MIEKLVATAAYTGCNTPFTQYKKPILSRLDIETGTILKSTSLSTCENTTCENPLHYLCENMRLIPLMDRAPRSLIDCSFPMQAKLWMFTGNYELVLISAGWCFSWHFCQTAEQGEGRGCSRKLKPWPAFLLIHPPLGKTQKKQTFCIQCALMRGIWNTQCSSGLTSISAASVLCLEHQVESPLKRVWQFSKKEFVQLSLLSTQSRLQIDVKLFVT